jgi:hypothetical protein
MEKGLGLYRILHPYLREHPNKGNPHSAGPDRPGPQAGRTFVAQRSGPGDVSYSRPETAGGGQDRAAALGWREDFHPNRPKTFARIPTIPQKATVVANIGKKSAGNDKGRDYSSWLQKGASACDRC